MRDPTNFDRLIDQGPWAATLSKPDGINHTVVVNDLHENLLEIWDPCGLDESLQQFGTRYMMQLEDLQNQWTWEALYFYGR